MRPLIRTEVAPLLRGQLARDARAALRELSAAFLLRRPTSRDPSLCSGEAGIAIVHVALECVFPALGHEAKAERGISMALRSLGSVPLGLGLWEGIAGVAWTAELLSGDPHEDLSPVDDALEEALDGNWPDSFDLAAGLAGVGVYALERLPRPSACRILTRVVDLLTATAERQGPGIAWRVRALPWDVGVAHGTPGVIALLGRVVASGIRVQKARRFLTDAVAWLLAQELPESSASRFPRTVLDGQAPEPARLAWCYGDLGVACALLVAAREARDAEWERHAVRIGMAAGDREPGTDRVADGYLCHGASGLAHLFHRLYRSTGEQAFARASRAWFARLLGTQWPRLHSKGLLEGDAGIALVLAAALDYDAAAGWDRALLIAGAK